VRPLSSSADSAQRDFPHLTRPTTIAVGNRKQFHLSPFGAESLARRVTAHSRSRGTEIGSRGGYQRGLVD
jgi:hypothetical protein